MEEENCVVRVRKKTVVWKGGGFTKIFVEKGKLEGFGGSLTPCVLEVVSSGCRRFRLRAVEVRPVSAAGPRTTRQELARKSRGQHDQGKCTQNASKRHGKIIA